MSRDQSQSRTSYRARWIFPLDGPPIERATIEIEDGRIVTLHDQHDPCAIELGNVAIIPGLVNAHTHLELSDVATPLPPAVPFTDWLRAVMTHRRARPASSTDAAQRLAAGRAECLAAGTTLLGDIVGSDWCAPATSSPALHETAFLELIGLSTERVGAQLSAAQRFLAGGETCDEPTDDQPPAESKTSLPGVAPSRVVRALSPHAPYSVHPDLFYGAVDLAVAHRVPLAIHLAETQAELQLLRDGTGEFRTFLEELGVWNSAVFNKPRRPLDFLEPLTRVECALAIHGNYFAADELEFLARHPGISVVYCPRTHAYFRHAPHPWRELLSRGINVALGTDSRASNPDLSIWSELLFLRRHFPEVAGDELLRLATANSARALGCHDRTGTLTVGKRADFAVVPLPDATASDPHTLLFKSTGKPVLLSRQMLEFV